MRRKIAWLALSCLIVAAILLSSCGKTTTTTTSTTTAVVSCDISDLPPPDTVQGLWHNVGSGTVQEMSLCGVDPADTKPQVEEALRFLGALHGSVDAAYREELVARFADRARRFGYGLVLTPIFEK